MPTPRVYQQDGVAVLDFGPGSHSLDESTVQSLQQSMLEASNVEPPLLVLDLTDVEFFGSSFIEVLFRVWSRIKNRRGRFALCGLSPDCLEIIEVTKLNTLWTIYDTVDEAVAALKSA